MKEIQLRGREGKDKVALVDAEYFNIVNKYRWYLKHGYAYTSVYIKGSKKGDKRSKCFTMHRLLMGLPDYQVDHINRNRLDNRKNNLRLATHSQNCQNSIRKKSKTGYIGVRQESNNVYVARVWVNNEQRIIGYYRTAIEAAYARDQAAIGLHGEFAVLNFSQEEIAEYTPVKLNKRNVGEITSATIGVSFARTQRRCNKWRAICKKIHLGWFYTEDDAIIAITKYKYENNIN